MESTGIHQQYHSCASDAGQSCSSSKNNNPTTMKSPFAVATMVANGSPTSDIRKRAVSLADTFERNAFACLDNFQGRITKYLSDNEKVKYLMKSDVEHVKKEMKQKDEEIEKIKMENLVLRTRIEEMQIRLTENERNLSSVKYENDSTVKKNVKLECKIEELDHSMTEMIKMKDSVIQSLTDQFSILCKELTEREGSIMELYKKQLLENQQLDVKSHQLQNKVKQNLKELAKLTNLVSQLQMESVKSKKEYESSIQKLREEYKNQLGKVSEMQQSFLPQHYVDTDDDLTKQKVFYETQIISLKKELKQLQDRYETQRKLSNESNETLLRTLSDRNGEISKLKSVVTSLNDQLAELKSQLAESRQLKKTGSATHLQIIIPPSPTMPVASSPTGALAAANSPPVKNTELFYKLHM